MRQAHFQPIVILSAFDGDLKINENQKRSFALRKYLDENGIDHSAVIGHYKGQREVSYLCLVNSENDLEVLKSVAFDAFNQDCILYSGKDRSSFLIYPNEETSSIGTMQNVEEIEARKLEAFTEVPQGNGQKSLFYICK